METSFQTVHLRHAVSFGRKSDVRKLLEAGADANATIGRGDTTLMLTTSDKRIDIARLLIEYGADINATNKIFGTTALMKAARNGQKETVRMLLDAGADITPTDCFGYNALDLADAHCHKEIANMLRNAGAVENELFNHRLPC